MLGGVKKIVFKSGWGKVFQVKNNKGLNFFGSNELKGKSKIQTNKEPQNIHDKYFRKKANPFKVCNLYKSLKFTKMPREK